jgi:hypothetical protein
VVETKDLGEVKRNVGDVKGNVEEISGDSDSEPNLEFNNAMK